MSAKRKPLTQTSLSSLKHFKSNSVDRRAGTIKRMTLCNFMCHSLLEVDFHRNITFLTGRNGSGKSAILTALVVGLGGKASLTNRGNSVKGFLKAGAHSGHVEIILYNEGFYAYKSEVYGRFITIQRHFTAAGSSSYKVRSETGEIISKSAKEVQNITSYFNIQVENPVCILNQDMARNFLSTSNPQHKYHLFVRATMLDVIAEQYAVLHTNRVAAVTMMQEKRDVLMSMRNQMEELKRKYDEHLALVARKDEIKSLQGELLWSMVQDVERDYAKEKKRFEAMEEQQRKLGEEVGNATGKYEAIREKIRKLQSKITEIKETLELEKVPEKDARKALIELREKYSRKMKQREDVEKTIQTKTNQCAAVAEEIRNSNENKNRIENERAEIQRKQQKYREELEKVENMLETAKNDLFNLKSDLTRHKEEQQEQLQQEMSHVDREIVNNRATLETLENESNNSLALYGRNIMRIVEEIQARQHEFKHLPRGPLGTYITVKDKKWASAVESLLGPALLGAFAVDNNKDNNVLMNIFNRICVTGRKPMLITSKFFSQMHDVRRYKVHAPQDCTSVFDALSFSDPVVANCLIDQMGIEGVLLVPNDDVAINLLSETANVPKNCKSALTLRCDTYYPSPNYRTYSGIYKEAKYLQTDCKQRIQQLKENIDSLRRRKQAARSQYDLLLQEKQQQLQQQRDIEAKVSELRGVKARLLQRCDALNNTAIPEFANADDLKNEMDALKASIVPLEAKVEQLKTEATEIKEEISETEDRLRKILKSIGDVEKRIAPLELQIMEEQEKYAQLETTERISKVQLEECNERLEHAKTELSNKEAELERHVENAEKMCERGRKIRAVAHIVAQINELQRHVRQMEATMEKPEEIKKRCDELYERHEKLAELIQNLMQSVEELGIADRKRRKYYRIIEEYFINYVKFEFEKVLEFRQFKGSLEINTMQKVLELIVIPQQGSQGCNSTSNLSGGERSFSTVAFLYALWKCMDLPFYFLDEFDVYMDKLNRTKVMEVLLYHAKRNPEKQYVFLTPQDVSFISDEEIAVHKLADPERKA